MARPEHSNLAVEMTFKDLETYKGWTITLSWNKREFILACKTRKEFGRITARLEAGQEMRNLIQRHAIEHPGE